MPARSIPLEESGALWKPLYGRFQTGAMSYGSISKEAHEAMQLP